MGDVCVYVCVSVLAVSTCCRSNCARPSIIGGHGYSLEGEENAAVFDATGVPTNANLLSAFSLKMVAASQLVVELAKERRLNLGTHWVVSFTFGYGYGCVW